MKTFIFIFIQKRKTASRAVELYWKISLWFLAYIFIKYPAISSASRSNLLPGGLFYLGEVLPRLAVPTTILMGAEDRLYPPERMRPFAALAPKARLEVVPSCGHLAPLEAPEVVVAALEGLSGGRA